MLVGEMEEGGAVEVEGSEVVGRVEVAGTLIEEREMVETGQEYDQRCTKEKKTQFRRSRRAEKWKEMDIRGAEEEETVVTGVVRESLGEVAGAPLEDGPEGETGGVEMIAVPLDGTALVPGWGFPGSCGIGKRPPSCRFSILGDSAIIRRPVSRRDAWGAVGVAWPFLRSNAASVEPVARKKLRSIAASLIVARYVRRSPLAVDSSGKVSRKIPSRN